MLLHTDIPTRAQVDRYSRHIDRAVRPVLNGPDVPLILAATEPLDSIFRSVNSYPHLVSTSLAGNPERTPDAELAASARAVLDEIARRAWLAGGTVLAVRAEDIPGDGPVAAILRYSM